jgi:hypothetical protein
MMDAMYDKDPNAVNRWFGQALQTVNPGTYPAGITPFVEVAFNYSLFGKRAITSASLQKLEAPDQYYEYTSGVAKQVSRILHDASGGKISLSPAKMDHLANGLSGGLYGNITAPIEKALSGEAWSTSDVPGLKGITLRKDYAKSVDDFYGKKEILDKSHESKKLHGKTGEENLDTWRKMQYVSALMTDMRKVSRTLPTDDQSKTGLALAGLARAALGRESLQRYPNPLADPSSVPDAVQLVIRKHIAQKGIAASASSIAGDKEAIAAVKYLRDMGISGGVAQGLAYSRLRSQGVKPDSAKVRVSMLGKISP